MCGPACVGVVRPSQVWTVSSDLAASLECGVL